MLNGAEITSAATYPNFGQKLGETTAKQGAILFSAESIRRLAEKIVRGITYINDGQFIESASAIDFFVLTDQGAKPIIELLETHGETFTHGPGIMVKRVLAEDDDVAAMYGITIFGRLKMYATVGVSG